MTSAIILRNREDYSFGFLPVLHFHKRPCQISQHYNAASFMRNGENSLLSLLPNLLGFLPTPYTPKCRSQSYQWFGLAAGRFIFKRYGGNHLLYFLPDPVRFLPVSSISKLCSQFG